MQDHTLFSKKVKGKIKGRLIINLVKFSCKEMHLSQGKCTAAGVFPLHFVQVMLSLAKQYRG